jgi:hypothetical protein
VAVKRGEFFIKIPLLFLLLHIQFNFFRSFL